MSDTPALQATELCRYYQVKSSFLDPARTLRALDGVSFAVESGQILAVVGESGCGKSTLARLHTLIEAPTAGSLKLAGVELSDRPPNELRRHRQDTQIIFQDPFGSLNHARRSGKSSKSRF